MAAVRVGVIGCGRAAAELHLPALARLPGVRVSAAADPDAAQLKLACDPWGIERQYADYRELIVDRSVDALLISVPTPMHYEIFSASVRSGKHIYVEKPLALTLGQADRMLADAARATGQVTVGFNLRSHRLVRKARELVRSGALGPIVLLRTLWVGGARKHPDWHSRSEEGGGVLYELGAHHFDLWRFLLDTEVVHVEAQDRMEWSDDSRAVVTARMLNGATASSIFTFCGPATHEIEVIGEAASLRFSVYRPDSLEIRPAGRIGRLQQWLRQLPGAARTAMLGGDYLDSVQTHWSRFLDSIEGGESPATLLDGRESLRIIRVAIDSLRHKEMA